jgi:predicted phosphodiesterase
MASRSAFIPESVKPCAPCAQIHEENISPFITAHRRRSCADCIDGPGCHARAVPPSAELVPDGSPTDGSVVRVALLADVHIDLTGQGDSPRFLSHLQSTIRQVNAAHVDLVLIAGDLSNYGKKLEWDDFKNRIRDFKAPVLYVPGNHDIANKLNTGKNAGVVTSEVYAKYANEMGPGFFVKEIAGLRVIGIAGSLFGSGLPEENQQWTMLDQALAEHSPLPTVVFSHYPLFAKSLDEPGGVYWNIEPEPRHRLFALMKASGVAAFLAGHRHHPFFADAEGLPCIDAPSVAWGIPTGTQPEGWTLVALPKNGKTPAAAYIHYIPH